MMELYSLQILNSNEKGFWKPENITRAYGIISNMFKILNREDWSKHTKILSDYC